MKITTSSLLQSPAPQQKIPSGQQIVPFFNHNLVGHFSFDNPKCHRDDALRRSEADSSAAEEKTSHRTRMSAPSSFFRLLPSTFLPQKDILFPITRKLFPKHARYYLPRKTLLISYRDDGLLCGRMPAEGPSRKLAMGKSRRLLHDLLDCSLKSLRIRSGVATHENQFVPTSPRLL